MPVFLKETLKKGRFSVNRLDGTKSEETFTDERIKAIRENTAKVQEAGWQIPVPWKHDGSKPITKDELASGKNNAGFVLSPTIDPTTGSLISRLEIPLEEDAKRLGKTVKEVSPMLIKDWVSPTGQVFPGEIIAHVALVTNPMQPGQENFIDYKPAENELAIAMSAYLGPLEDEKLPVSPQNNPEVPRQGTDTTSIGACLDALRTRGIDLPEDTNESNLVERLIIACRAITGADSQGENPQQPEGNQQPQPIAMSQNMANDVQYQKLHETLQNTHKASFRSRIDALLAKGLSKQVAETVLNPLCEGYQLSQNEDGSIATSELETRLSTLEAVYATAAPQSGSQFFNMSQNVPPGSEEPHQKFSGPWNQEEVISEGEEFDKLVAEQLALVQ